MTAAPSVGDLPDPIAERLVETLEGHWIWTGWHNDAGYPYVHHEGRDQPAYRVVWTLLVGPIPDGLELDHLCVTPPCCNPRHLDPVTHAENQRRIAERQTRCRRAGHSWQDPANVYTRPNGRRLCRACATEIQRARRAETRSAA